MRIKNVRRPSGKRIRIESRRLAQTLFFLKNRREDGLGSCGGGVGAGTMGEVEGGVDGTVLRRTWVGSDRLEYISRPQTQHDLLLQHGGFSADRADLKHSLQS